LRVFLIIFSFINAVFYIFIYSYSDRILEIIGGVNLSAVAINYIRLAALLIVGFCVGVIVMLLLKLKLKRSLFSFKNMLIVGFFPFICLVLSEGTITSFIINKFFNSSEQLSELAFYLFSRQSIWSLWLGFSIGSSIRFGFSRREFKHVSIVEKDEEKKISDSLMVKDSDTEKQGHNHSPEY